MTYCHTYYKELVKMPELSDLITKNEKLINKINENILSSVFSTVKRVYIDLALLKDTRMGLMLSLSDSDDVQYLLSKLPLYNIRPNRSFTETYPDFKLDENTLNKYYHDPSYSEDIFNNSPDTDFSINLKTMIRMYSSANTRGGYSKPIDITINTFPLQITDNIKIFNRILDVMFKGAAIFNLISTDPKQISEESWSNYSVLYIDDINYTLTDSNLYKALFDHQRMTNSTIFSPYCCDDKILDKWKQYKVDLTKPNITNDLFKVTEYILSAFCYFSFIPFQIPLPNQE